MIASVFSSSGGSGQNAYVMKIISDQIDNTTRNFVLKPFRSGSLLVFYNGLAQSPNEIVELSNSSFQTTFVPSTGSTLLVFYQPL